MRDAKGASFDQWEGFSGESLDGGRVDSYVGEAGSDLVDGGRGKGRSFPPESNRRSLRRHYVEEQSTRGLVWFDLIDGNETLFRVL